MNPRVVSHEYQIHSIPSLTNEDRVYISGPMTGMVDFNREAFANMEQVLIKNYNCKIFNPAFAYSNHDLPYHDYLRPDLSELCSKETTAIVFLRNWWRSNGARLEFDVARNIGIKMYDEFLRDM